MNFDPTMEPECDRCERGGHFCGWCDLPRRHDGKRLDGTEHECISNLGDDAFVFEPEQEDA